MPIRGTWARTSIWAAAIAIYLTLIAWGARGLRGSDQYWYATDLVMKGRLVAPSLTSSPRSSGRRRGGARIGCPRRCTTSRLFTQP